MARHRTIKPKFYNDRALAGCSIQARYLFKALWVFADDLGVIINEPNWIKSQVFPYDKTLRTDEVVKWLDALVSARMIEPFTFKGEGFYNIRSFRTHQRIDRPNHDDVNVSEEDLKIILSNLDNYTEKKSTNDRRTFVEGSLPEKSREEESREEKRRCAGARDSAEKNLVVQMPFESENFKIQWGLWKDYKAQEHKFNYKSAQSEQAALNDLVKLSEGKEESATKIIHQSMANGWKGFFELKIFKNGKDKHAAAELSAEGAHGIFSSIYSENGKR